MPPPVRGARQLLKQSQVVKVDRSRDVATVEPHLLLPRQARHNDPLQHTLGERFGRVVKAAAVHVGLTAMSATVEDHRVQVDPATAGSDDVALSTHVGDQQRASTGQLVSQVETERQLSYSTSPSQHQ